MTKEQINIAIAEAQGWKLGEMEEPSGSKWKAWINQEGKIQVDTLDYCNDLNAMHEVENQIAANLEDLYEFWLRDLTKTSALAIRRSFIGECFDLVHATALQRAEAYLRTIGKWKEE